MCQLNARRSAKWDHNLVELWFSPIIKHQLGFSCSLTSGSYNELSLILHICRCNTNSEIGVVQQCFQTVFHSFAIEQTLVLCETSCCGLDLNAARVFVLFSFGSGLKSDCGLTSRLPLAEHFSHENISSFCLYPRWILQEIKKAVLKSGAFNSVHPSGFDMLAR